MFFYQGFGLRFESDRRLISVPVSPVAGSCSRVRVCFETCPEPIPEYWDYIGGYFKFNEDEFLCDVPDVARFRVRGDVIWVETAGFNLPNSNLIEAHLFGPILAALLQRQRRLTYHANAIVVNGAGMLLSGWPSVGKSSLAFSLIKQGAIPLSDDLCALTETSDGILCCPGVAHIKLMPDILEHFELAVEDTQPITDVVGKHICSLWPEEDQRHRNSVESDAFVKDVIFIQRSNSDKGDLLPLAGGMKFKQLKEQLFRPQFLPSASKAAALRSLMILAEQSRVWELRMPTNIQRLDETASMLLKSCRE